MRAPIFAANWKMHHGPKAARDFVTQFLKAYPRRDDRTVILAPSAISIEAVATALGDRREILTGIQNIWTEPKGAFTGECSAPMAKEAGAQVVIVGHSERRHVFGETIEQTSLKCLRAFESGMTPMLCVGEKFEQREAGTTEKVVMEQLRGGLAKLSKDQILQMPIAYEPVWAIGTGKTATPADASAVHKVIRQTLTDLAGSGAAMTAILYGGSVNEGNAGALLAAKDVSGLLVGGASLDHAGWARICST
jgi:triosephosphate isomerase